MKAITVWQPWASLLAIGAKEFETRSWATAYRGPIAIHASKKDAKEIMRSLPADTQMMMFDRLYEHYGRRDSVLRRLPTGAVIATAELVNVWYTALDGAGVLKAIRLGPGRELMTKESLMFPTAQERLFGDWTPGRYVWQMKNVKLLPEPVPTSGKQGLWDWRR